MWRSTARRLLSVCVCANAAIIVVLSLCRFLVPAGMLAGSLRDPGLRQGEIRRCAFRWHRALDAPVPRLQLGARFVLPGTAILAWPTVGPWLAVVLLLAAQILPWQRQRRRAKAETEVAVA